MTKKTRDKNFLFYKRIQPADFPSLIVQIKKAHMDKSNSHIQIEGF